MIDGELIVDNRYRGTGKSKSERIMRCKEAAKLPRGSPGRRCRRAIKIRIKSKKKIEIKGGGTVGQRSPDTVL